MKHVLAILVTQVPDKLKLLMLLCMMMLISFSPVIFIVFEMYETYEVVYEIVDEDDSKEKIVFSYDEEIHNQTLCSRENQLSPNPDILATEFMPEVLLPPPKCG